MMLWELLRDNNWRNTNRGFRLKNGKVVWTDAVKTQDVRRRVRVTRTDRERTAWGSYSRKVTAYLRPHTEVELVPKKVKAHA